MLVFFLVDHKRDEDNGEEPDSDCGYTAHVAAVEKFLEDGEPTRGQLIVTIEGGMLSSVSSHDPALIGLTYRTVDYDTDGGDEDEVVQVTQGDGSESDAYVGEGTVDRAEITLPSEAA